MGLNETLDRLAKDREVRESAQANVEADNVKRLPPLVQDYAIRIFFERMLKDINHGMSEPKIDAMIERSVMIAQKLAERIYPRAL